MATSFTSVSFTTSPKSVSWCFLLGHLDEFVTLVWYLAAHGKFVEDTFARTMAKFDMTAFEFSISSTRFTIRLETFSSLRRWLYCRTRAERKMKTSFFSRVLSVTSAYSRVHRCRWRVRHGSSKLRGGPGFAETKATLKVLHEALSRSPPSNEVWRRDCHYRGVCDYSADLKYS